jgi:anti-anti-sigma factor
VTGDRRGHRTAAPATGRDGHQLLIAPTVGDLGRGLTWWAASALLRGDTLVYAADAVHPTADRLVETLVRHGFDARDLGDGDLVVVEPERFYSADGYPELVERALDRSRAGVRTFGGRRGAAAVLDGAGFAEFECVLEQVWERCGVSAVCCYDRPAAPGNDGWEAAIDRHPSGWGERMLHAALSGTGRLHLRGEVDMTNDRLLAEAVGAAARRAGPVLEVECVELVFMSVHGWRVLVAGTEEFRRSGGRVRLSGVSSAAQEVLRVIGAAGELEVARTSG